MLCILAAMHSPGTEESSGQNLDGSSYWKYSNLGILAIPRDGTGKLPPAASYSQQRICLLSNLMLTWWEVVDGSLTTQSDLCYYWYCRCACLNNCQCVGFAIFLIFYVAYLKRFFSPPVYRIRSVLDSFVPLIDRFRPRGNSAHFTDSICLPWTFLGALVWSRIKINLFKLQFPILRP